MSTPFHDRLTELAAEVETEIASHEAALAELRPLHDALKSTLRPNAFEQRTGLTLTNPPTSRKRPKASPSARTGIYDDILTSISSTHTRGMTFDMVRDVMEKHGYNVRRPGGGGLNVNLGMLLKHGKVRKDGDRYIFVSR